MSSPTTSLALAVAVDPRLEGSYRVAQRRGRGAEQFEFQAAAELHEPPEQWPRTGKVGKKRVGVGIRLAHDASRTVVAEEPVVLQCVRLATNRRQRFGGE